MTRSEPVAPTETEPFSADDVARAATVLDGVAHRTPVLRSRTLDALVGAHVLCKAENFQRTGTFKFRGAYNAIASLLPAVRRRGVCTVSSGNHAQAVALAARLLDVPCVVLMPDDAPAVKRAAVVGYGAEVVTYDRDEMPQWQAGDRLEEERGLPFISSHDAPAISAGAGTALVELLDDSGPIDMLVAGVGGGGGFAGYATAVKARLPHARIIAAEPAASGLLAASLAAGRLLERAVPTTIADGMRLTRLGRLPWRVMQEAVDGVVGVSEAQIVAAMKFAFERMKIVLEPSGAVALGALMAGAIDCSGQRVAVVFTGGNIAPSTFTELVSSFSD